MAKDFDLTLKGFVGGWDFDSDYVDYVLDKFSERHVSVMIDSLGGHVDTALSIKSAFANHGDVSVHFRGMNASAATIASMGAKHIAIESSAMYLVHKCSSDFFDWSTRNADELNSYIEELQKHKSDLDKIDSVIADLYARRCKKSAKDMLDLMKVGGWLTAQEAKAWGFVDEIIEDEAVSGQKISHAMAYEMKAAGIPMPKNIEFSDEDQKSIVDEIKSYIKSIFKPSAMEKPEDKQEKDKPENPVQDNEDSKKKKEDGNSDIEDLQQKIKDLEAEIANLKKKPAEDSKKVVENSKDSKDDKKSPIEEFLATTNSAGSLFISIP